MKMNDIEWVLRRLADSSILAHPELYALETACRIVAALRQNLHYNPDMTSPDDAVLLIQQNKKA